MPFDIKSFIATKRLGGRHDEGAMRAWIEAFQRDEVKDYHMSAWAMAVCLRGLDEDECAALTLAMVEGGTRLQRRAATPKRVDKHSTGGVGDKVSLALAPWVAACGLHVPMIAGRGLGHTGGTIDKLEAIPGFRSDLSPAQMEAQLASVGCFVVGQTQDIAPVDKRLYALRDVTGTVESVALITASILSKKLAEDLDGLVLDIKVGAGAFMKTRREAQALEASLRAVGGRLGLRVETVRTDMDTPLGRSVGNALEVGEAFALLHGQGDERLREVTRTLAAKMLVIGEGAPDQASAFALLDEALRSGAALDRARRWVEAQGGDPRVVEDPSLLPHAEADRVLHVDAATSGYFVPPNAQEVGVLALRLGAGRQVLGDVIDMGAGFHFRYAAGDWVEKGACVMDIHPGHHAEDVQSRFQALALVQPQPPLPVPVVDIENSAVDVENSA